MAAYNGRYRPHRTGTARSHRGWQHALLASANRGPKPLGMASGHKTSVADVNFGLRRLERYSGIGSIVDRNCWNVILR